MIEYSYCPHCASKLAVKYLYGRNRNYCPTCGFIHFRDPRLAVGGLITEGERVLLIRRLAAPRIGFWAVPSGFVEYDEQPRPALAREIEEETGLVVEVGRVIEAYPNADASRPGVFLLFEARPAGGQLRPGDDVSEARWFSPADIPWPDLAFAQMNGVLRAFWRLDGPESL